MCLLNNNLPLELFSSVVSTWLTIIDVTHLDSAVCNRALRGDFLNRAYKFGDCLAYLDTISMWDEFCGQMTAWIFRKGAPVAGFYAVSTFMFNHAERKKYLQHRGKCVKWVEFAPTFGAAKQLDQCRKVAMDLAEFCPKMERLNSADRLDNAGLQQILQRCPKLEDVAAGGGGITSRTAIEMSHRFTTLKRLELLNEHVSEHSLITLVRANPGLVSFFTSANGATEKFVRELALNCTGLTQFFAGCISVTHASLCFLLKNCIHLHSLALNIVHYTVTDSLETEPTLCPSMRIFLLNRVHCYEGLSKLSKLLRACRNLTRFDIWECPALPEDAFLPLSERFPYLQDITLFDCGFPVRDEVLLDISKHYPKLRELTVPFSDDLTRVGLVAVAAYCPHLQHVDVSSCAGVTNSFLFALAQNCHDLRVLMVAQCAKITDVGVTAVMKGCPDLVKLGVDGCSGLTVQLAWDVGQRYPHSG